MLTKPIVQKTTTFTGAGVKLHLEVDCIHVYGSIIRSHVYTGDYNSINWHTFTVLVYVT